tara:strand:- start:7902 stop:8696 length:795 start_codon:yes stop_codon:yes gene_type:complete
MCNPVTGWQVAQFGAQAAGQVGSYMSQRAGVNARNRAKLLNFRQENISYYNDVLLRNTQWKNDLQDTEIAYDNIFQQTAEAWRQQDLAIEQAYDQAARDNLDILQQIYRKEYAGTQTGVTASRLANEPLRQGGIKMTEAMQKAIRVDDEATLKKDILTSDANRRRRSEFQKTWRSPVHGWTPEAPALEGGPSTGALVLGLAASAVGSFGESWFSSDPNILNSSNLETITVPSGTTMNGMTLNAGDKFWSSDMPINRSYIAKGKR